MSGLRVLLVNDEAPGPTGGVEVHLDRLARGLEAAGDTVELFAGEITHTGAAKVLDVWDPWARRRLAELAVAFRPDVVHHHNVVRELSPSVLGVPRGVPSVLTVHDHRLLGRGEGTGLAATLRSTKARMDRAIARRQVEAIVAVSEPLAADLARAGFDRVLHVPPMVEVDPGSAPRPAGDCDETVVYAGRLAPDKGVDVLLEAFDLVAERRPAARLRLAGDGPLRAAAETAASRWGRERVAVLGQLPPALATAELATARVVVVPSVPHLRPEGLPTVALEAATLGRPLVTSDDPGLAAFVEAARAGISVAAGSATALADAIERFLADPGTARRHGEAGETFARDYCSSEAVTRRLRALYRSLSEGAAAGGDGA